MEDTVTDTYYSNLSNSELDALCKQRGIVASDKVTRISKLCASDLYSPATPWNLPPRPQSIQVGGKSIE